MIHNIKLEIAYDGSSYNGWQRQGNTNKTIQGILESTISNLLDDVVEIHGSGRTDAGVHAKGQVANFYTKSKLDRLVFMNKLNRTLPDDIKILNMQEVEPGFHARCSAKAKMYSYSIWNSDISNVFGRKYVYEMEPKLDVKVMKEASQFLIGEHDFRSFCSDKNMEKSSIRTIHQIDMDQIGDKITISYTGSGFLYNMVRIMTGTLIEVGLMKRSPNSIIQILEMKNREASGFTAPPQGLCLEHVYYENIE